MAKSSLEFYQNGNNGKIDIDWYGNDNGGNEVFNQAEIALNLIDNALIVARFAPSTGSTCLRMILNITREAQSLGVETRVVLPKKGQYNAAQATGFDRLFKVFPTEEEAIDDFNLDPVAA